MRHEIRTVYIADDGSGHSTEEGAFLREECNAFTAFLENHPALYFGREGSSCPAEIFWVLKEEYTITRKPFVTISVQSK